MTPDTLRDAAAITDARAANGHPEWRRIADELDAEAARIDATTTADGEE